MANICFNDITMVGDKAILQRLQKVLRLKYLNKKPAGNLAGNIFIKDYIDYIKRTLYNDKRYNN